MGVCEVTERGFLIAMGYTGRKGNSKKLLEKASILEAVGSVGSSSMWNMGIRLCASLAKSLHGAILALQKATG